MTGPIGVARFVVAAGAMRALEQTADLVEGMRRLR